MDSKKKNNKIYRSTTSMCVRLHCDHFTRIMGHSFGPRVIYTVHKQSIHLSTSQSRPIFSCKFNKFNNFFVQVVNKDNGVAFVGASGEFGARELKTTFTIGHLSFVVSQTEIRLFLEKRR